jgi:hemerythrin
MDRLFQQISDRNRELFELNQSLEARVEQRTQELSEANRRLEGLALTDTLTGLGNRRAAMRKLHAEWGAGESTDRPLACIMIDVDGFKGINDRHGHDSGDEVLRCLARGLNEAVRTDDTLCRLGGDEFLVICSRTPLPGAMRLAEDLRQEAKRLRVPVGPAGWLGSISVGVAVRGPGMGGPDDLLKAADEGLYVAKRSGRDRVATVCGPS